MDGNYALQLGVEDALKGFIPYLRSLPDSEQLFDFLDTPFPDGSVYISGLRRDVLPENDADFVAVVSQPPKWMNARHTIGDVIARFELGTGGMKDAENVAANTSKHSARAAALQLLFSRPYLATVLPLLRAFAPKLTWHGYDPAGHEYGQSENGNMLLDKPSYSFRVSWAP